MTSLGKFVLLDFSASWCGGCRLEAKKLVPIYDKLKGDDLAFISISLDNREKDWRRMVKEDQLPWVLCGIVRDSRKEINPIRFKRLTVFTRFLFSF